MNMIRSFVIASLAALAVSGAAYGAYPGTYGLQDGPMLQWGSLQIRASNAAGDTAVSAGAKSVTVNGSYGIPTMITTNTPLGLFHDGSAFVLQSTGIEKHSSFVVMRTEDLQVAQTITLPGSFAFDALAPDGRTLYLIEHRSSDFQHYVVRAYDLKDGALLPG